MSGVALNIVTIVLGTVVGVLFGRVFPQRFRQMVFYAIGACTITFGAIVAIGGYRDLSESNIGSLAAIVLVVSLVAGALSGELLRLEQRLEGLGNLLERLLSKRRRANAFADAAQDGSKPPAASVGATIQSASVDATLHAAAPGDAGESASSAKVSGSTFAEGFMTASIFFCAGAMTILGSIQAGLGDPSTLYLKSTLDGISSLALSTALGVGVGFSALTVLVVQGSIALGALALSTQITPAIMAAIELVGGTMLIALGIEILGIKKLRVGNLLPALAYAVILAILLG
jgi:uncharacterized membrane protein YqgA involved in biofilm formation